MSAAVASPKTSRPTHRRTVTAKGRAQTRQAPRIVNRAQLQTQSFSGFG